MESRTWFLVQQWRKQVQPRSILPPPHASCILAHSILGCAWVHGSVGMVVWGCMLESGVCIPSLWGSVVSLDCIP